MTSLITPYEAQRAFYIDFEGFQNKPPSFIGWVWAIGRRASDDNLACIHDIHEVTLRPLVGEAIPDFPSIHDYKQRNYSLRQSINDLARRAVKQDRRIVSWSTHELTKIAESELPDELLRGFQHNYRDGKITAKAWFRQLGLDTSNQTNRLTRYLKQADYVIPNTYGLGHTTKRLRSVIKGLNTRGSWSELIPSQQNSWDHLLLHNLIDCHGLRHITKMAAAAIDTKETD